MRRVSVLLCLTLLANSVGLAAQTPRGNSPRQPRQTEEDAAIEFCREQALIRLKYQKTVKWNDLAKNEGGGVYLVAGVRDAKSQVGEAFTQQYTCRVQKSATGWKLRMIQLFRESTKSGRNVFETYPDSK